MTVSMTIVSTMGVSQTMVSQMMTVSQTESVSVSIVSIGLRLSLSFSLVQSVDGLEGAGNTRVELADSVSVSVDGSNISVSVVRVSLSAPLSDVVSVDSMKTLGRPGYERSGVSSMVSN